MLKPFTYTTHGLPLVLTPHEEYPGIYRVLLCGIQLAEAFHGTPMFGGQSSFVAFTGPEELDIPDAVHGDPDETLRMKGALDIFAASFLAAAAAEQGKIGGAA
jgi:hypothetical protein